MSFTPTYNVMKVVDRVSPPCRERVGGASRGQPTRGNRALRSDPATTGGSDAGQRSEDPVTPPPIHNGTHTSPTGITQRHFANVSTGNNRTSLLLLCDLQTNIGARAPSPAAISDALSRNGFDWAAVEAELGQSAAVLRQIFVSGQTEQQTVRHCSAAASW